MTIDTGVATPELLLALFVICLIGQMGTVYLAPRCLEAVRRRQTVQVRLAVDEDLIDQIATAAAQEMDADTATRPHGVLH
jgi:hypothetical protein